MSRSLAVAVLPAAFVLAVAGGCPGPPRGLALLPHDKACDLPHRAAQAFCPSCGLNSPMVNVFPYNGLHPDGCVNEDGASLAKFSLARGISQCDSNSTDPLYLDVAAVDDASPNAGFELVAKDAQNVMRCRGINLVGMTFIVVTPQGSQTTLRISQMGTTSIVGPVLPVVGPSVAEARPLVSFTAPAPQKQLAVQNTRPVYLITPYDQPARSLCTSPPPEVAVPTSTPVLMNRAVASGTSTDIDARELASYVMIVPGAVYRGDATLIPASVTADHRWFNFACTDDALAQTELIGLPSPPIVDTDTANQRLPALHMFTAKYCGGLSATTRGTPIAIRLNGATTMIVPHAGTGPVEAHWGPTGATCVSHSRLWIANKTVALPQELVDNPAFQKLSYPEPESDFLRRLCPVTPGPCDGSEPPGVLISYTVNHLDR